MISTRRIVSCILQLFLILWYNILGFGGRMKKIILFLKKLWHMFIGLFRKNKKTLDKAEYDEYTESFSNKRGNAGGSLNTSQNNANRFYFDKMIFLAIPMIVLWALFDKEKKVKVYHKSILQQDIKFSNSKENLKTFKLDEQEVMKSREVLERKKDILEDPNKKDIDMSVKKDIDRPFKLYRVSKGKIMVGPKDEVNKNPIKLDEAMEVCRLNDEDIIRQKNNLNKKKGLMAIESIMTGVLTVPILGILGIGYIGRAFRAVKVNNRLSMALNQVDDNSLRVRRINPFMFFSKKRTEKFTNKLQMSNLMGVQRLRTGVFRKYGKDKSASFKNVIKKTNLLENELRKSRQKKQNGKIKVLKGKI